MNLKFILLFSYLSVSLLAYSEQLNKLSDSSPIFTSGLDENFQNSYNKNNLLYLGAGIGLTVICVMSNLDAKMLEATSKMNRHTTEQIGFPGIIGGYIFPVSIPAGLYLLGNDEKTKYASYSAGQAVIISGISNAMLKAITGRIGPNPDSKDKIKDSRDFKFGFLRRGIHYGWPSGHMMTNTAMVVAINCIYEDNKLVQFAGLTWLAYLTTSVLIDEGGDVHWLSDIITGSLVGYAIGKTTGNYFKNKLNCNTTTVNKYSKNKLEIVPSINPKHFITLSYIF